MPLTIADLMSKMPGAFLPEKALGLDAIIQFKFTGAEAGNGTPPSRMAKCVAAQGVPSDPEDDADR